MCGFVGTLNGNTLDPADGALVARLGECLRHRGPDEHGTHADGPLVLAHHRLRILDLSAAGRQPMCNADQSICIAYNGEVYNFRELRRKHALDRRGFRFRSATDTEVLLYLYELLGINFVKELNGMFALAIWDKRQGRLFLVRDRFGIKPLFYTQVGQSLWFASEIKALLQVPEFERKPCLEALHHYFSFDYIPGEWTAFEGIREVRPGTILEARTGEGLGLRSSHYYTFRFGDRIPERPNETIEEVRTLLEAAVARHLISDVPVGVMLSGGLDSSTLAALTAKVRNDPDFHTFSITFDEPSFDESAYADIMARHLGTRHHQVRVTPRDVIDTLEVALSFIDEPYADGSAIPTYLLARTARDYVTVLLSGEGGDEVFAGYDTHRAYLVRKAYRRFPPALRRLAGRFVARLPVSHTKLSLGFKARKFVRGAESSVPVSHFLWRDVFSEAEKQRLLRIDRDAASAWGPSCALFEDCFQQLDSKDELNSLLGVDCSYHLPDDLMIKNDRMTMAHSLEARVPFTDLALFETMAGLAGSVKLARFQGKYLLKQAMAPLLPPRILHKKKVGLEMPYSHWFCHELKDLLLSTLSERALKDQPLLNAAFVQDIIREHLEHRADRGRELWGLLNFAVWYRLYFLEQHNR